MLAEGMVASQGSGAAVTSKFGLGRAAAGMSRVVGGAVSAKEAGERQIARKTKQTRWRGVIRCVQSFV
jgi:hypothetical protein